ncbi:hypothetical protein SBA4_3390021 [Candidatus Sulfopaludibacter sp. SbA4]|nr:hypothetical protein SBA4_3390021 [Candidatus Sulfopaludibacter sp. SbA4]
MKRVTLIRIFTSVDGPVEQPTREELILRFMPMVERIAGREYRKQRSYGNNFIDLADIRGELTVNLIRLIDRFEEGRSDSLEAYLAQHLGWRVVDAVDSSRVMRDVHEPFISTSGQEAISSADLPASLGAECLARGRRRGRDGRMHPIPLHADQAVGAGLDLGGLLDRLGAVDRAVVETYLAMLTELELVGKSTEVTQLEVANEMGVSQATVSRALKKIRDLMHKKGL